MHSHTHTYSQACAECSLCNAGEYIAAESFCTGATYADTSAGKCRPCRASCPAGQYLSGSCVTGKEIKDRMCLPCTSKCPAGYYALGRYDGSSTYDTRRCVPCGFCQPGQYQMGFCDGTTSTDATKCAPCNFTTCKPLHVLVNQCTGRGTNDTSKCVACSESNGIGCSANQYMAQMCSPASLYDGKCQNCDISCISAASGSAQAPTGQYKLIPCNGLTNSNLVCANCTQNCPVGEYVTNLCDGMGTKDTAKCAACTCPAGTYAPNNTCVGNTTRNVLVCTACTKADACPDGYYLSGECSTFSNPVCTPCRSACGVAEIEAQKCSGEVNRLCLPDVACFQDCPSGSFESRPCSPPNVKQQCTACSSCAKGYYVQQPCSPKNDTKCERCTSSICIDDAYNAQFSAVTACQGTERQDPAQCGVITESYGQRCAPNSYRIRSRVGIDQG